MLVKAGSAVDAFIDKLVGFFLLSKSLFLFFNTSLLIEYNVKIPWK